MTFTNRFNQNTDFVMLASDGEGDMILNVPSGSTIPPLSNRFFESFQTIGDSAASPLRCIFQINGSAEYVIATKIFLEITVTVGSVSTTSELEICVQRMDGNTIRLYAMYSNSSSSTVTVTGNTNVVAKIRTFKTPFENPILM